MAKKRSFSNTKSQKVKNREYKVAITRLRLNDAVFLDALLKYHGIRDCAVKLHRMNDPTNHSLVEKKQKKKLLRSTEKNPSVRLHVPWLPTVQSMKTTSSKTVVLDKNRSKLL